METPNEYLSLLIDLLPKYRQLNSLYQKATDNSILNFEEQCSITDFHNEFKDTQFFEKAVLNLLLSADKERQMQIISNLRTEISKNIAIYTTHKELFDGIDTVKVCASRYNPLHIEIEEQQKDINKIWQKLIQIRNSLESASWNNDKITIQRLTNEEERLENSYKKEQTKIQILYKQKEESDKHAIQYSENQFGNIHELSQSFLTVINGYFPEKKEKTEGNQTNQSELTEIEPDTIFRTRMYEKFLSLEQKLIRDKYRNNTLHWIAMHDNRKPDIKSLITFMVALLDNKYFLPNKDPKIKSFFESRYHINIGQNFERKRRESLIDEYNF